MLGIGEKKRVFRSIFKKILRSFVIVQKRTRDRASDDKIPAEPETTRTV